jgi:hypothetical protein
MHAHKQRHGSLSQSIYMSDLKVVSPMVQVTFRFVILSTYRSIKCSGIAGARTGTRVGNSVENFIDLLAALDSSNKLICLQIPYLIVVATKSTKLFAPVPPALKRRDTATRKSSVERTMPRTHGRQIQTLTRRRFPDFLDRRSGIGGSSCVYKLSIRGCTTKSDRACSSGLALSTAHRMILVAAFKSRFTNSMSASTLVERTMARNCRTRALCAIWCTVSSACFCIAEALRGFRCMSSF